MKNRVQMGLIGAAGAVGLLLAGVAQAFTITYSGLSSEDNLPVSAIATVTLSQVDELTIGMRVVVENTSATAGSRITGITFGWNPNLVLTSDPDLDWENGAGTSDDSVFDTLASQLNGFPNGIDVDYCPAVGDNCAGGGDAGGGLAQGATDAGFTLTFAFVNPTTTSFLEDWMFGRLTGNSFDTCIRVKGIGDNGDSAKVCDYTIDDEERPPVPEPGTLALLGLGLLGLAFSRRRAI